MRYALFGSLLAVLILVAVVLFLHLEESDSYPLGSLAPNPESPTIPWLDTIPAKNERVAWLVDRNGWHHLWNAGNRRMYYNDPGHLIGELKNRTAGDPGGEWLIEGPGLRLRYVLKTGTYPGDESVKLPDGPAVPRRVPWFTRRARSDRSESLCDYWWQLAP